MLLKCCIICYRKLDEDVSVGKCRKNRESDFWNVSGEETGITVSKFFQFLERYLDDSEGWVAEGKDGSRKHSTGVFKAMLKGGMLGSCGDCLKLLNEFCEIYHRMKEMELMLNWKLWTIKNIMGSAKKVGARIAIFRESVRNLVAGEDVGNADEIANAIFVFKKETSMKCTRRLQKFPKVKIHRCLPNAQTDPIDRKCHISGAKEQEFVLNKAEKSMCIGRKTEESTLPLPTNLHTEINESDLGTTVNNIGFQMNSELETTSPNTSITSCNENLSVRSSAENIEVISYLKFETMQAEDSINLMDTSSLEISTNANDATSTVVSSLSQPDANKDQPSALISNDEQAEENTNFRMKQTTKSQKITTNPTDDDISITTPHTFREQVDEAQTQKGYYFPVTPNESGTSESEPVILLLGNQQVNCNESSLIQQTLITTNKSEESATVGSHKDNNISTDISSYKLGKVTEAETQLGSCDIYSPCNSIISVTAQESNFESDNLNIQRDPEVVDAPEDGKANITSFGAFLSSGNISLNDVEDSEATSSYLSKEVKKNTELSSASRSEINEDPVPHGNFDEINVDLERKSVQFTTACDRTTQDKNEENCYEENIPESAKSPIANIRSLRAIHRCSKCAKSFSTKKKLAEHEEAHDIDGDFESDSEFSCSSSSFCDSLSEEENEEVVDENTRNRKTNSNKKCRKDSYPCEMETCTEVFSTFQDFSTHQKLHGVFSCNVCKVTFSFAPDLAVHEVIEHPIIPKDCGEKFTENLYYCPRPRCVFVVEGRDTYIQHHLWKHQQLVSYKLSAKHAINCNVCKLSIQAADKSRLKVCVDSHQQSHHHPHPNTLEDSPETFKCGITHCTAHFLNADQLTIHKCKIHGIGKHLDSFSLSPLDRGTTESVHKSSGNSKISSNSRKHRVAAKPNPLTCHFCKIKSSNASETALHESIEHSSISAESRALSPNIYQCPRPNCVFTVEGKVAFIHHFMTQHLKIKYSVLENFPKNVCSICNKVVNGEVGKPAALSKYLNCHYNALHNMKTPGAEVYRCKGKDCSAYFVTARQVKSHQIKEHGISENYCKCDLCNKRFSHRGAVSDHRKRVHKEIIKLTFPCLENECGKRFENERDLQRHINLSHKGYYSNIFNCEICNKTVRGKSSLATHVKAQHSTKEPDRFVCEKCGKEFLLKKWLEIHSLSHSGPNSWQFSCSVCQKKCISKQKLEEHMRIHTKEKPFVCDICGEKYAHRHNLRIHVNNKHGDVGKKDLPRHFDKTNLTSRKGVKRKKPVEPEPEG